MQRWIQLAQQGLLGAARVLRDKSPVLEAREPAARAFFLRSGAVELLHRGEDGAAVIVKLLVGPTLFGAIEAVGEESAYLESVRCAGRAMLHPMSRDAFAGLLASDLAAANECLTDMAVAFCTAARLEPSRLASTEALLSNLLLAYLDVFGAPQAAGGTLITLKRTQSDFSEGIGATERSVNRVLKDWKAAGVLAKGGGRYTVFKPEVLRRLAKPLANSLVHRYPAAATRASFRAS